MVTPCWCPFEGHKHGHRKPTETSVFEFPYKCVNSSLEELIKTKVIFYSETKECLKMVTFLPYISASQAAS